MRAAYAELEGHFAFVAMTLDEPDVLVGARKECPLIIGRGEGETFLASAIPAFLRETRNVQYIENGEIVVCHAGGNALPHAGRRELERDVVRIDWDEETAEKGGFETFMLKEIHEQADAVAETIADRTVREDGVDLDEPGALDEQLLRRRQADRHRRLRHELPRRAHRPLRAGAAGRACRSRWTSPRSTATATRSSAPATSSSASRSPGETADTLAAMRIARDRGATVLAITNIMGSQATRDADGVLFTRAGLEVSVAATKTFVCQVAVMYLLALRLAELRGTLGPRGAARARRATSRRIPHDIEAMLERVDADVQRDRRRPTGRRSFFLYLGRHVGLPVALEGALKLKEISYIATDAYAAGEMKHGPIALLDDRTPVVTVATDSPVLDKVVSNMQEVRARGAHVVAVATEGNEEIAEHAEQVLHVPAHELDAPAAAGRDPAAAPGLPDRTPAAGSTWTSRATSRKRSPSSSLGGSAPGGCAAGGWRRLDLLEIERLERALERRPGLRERLFTEAELAYAARAGAARRSTSRRASARRRRSARRWRWTSCARATSRSCATPAARPGSRCTAPSAQRGRRSSASRSQVSLTHTRAMAGAGRVAVAA